MAVMDGLVSTLHAALLSTPLQAWQAPGPKAEAQKPFDAAAAASRFPASQLPAASHQTAGRAMKTVVVFQGGGALGAFGAGAWQALADEIDSEQLVAVAGASIGAINAAVVA